MQFLIINLSSDEYQKAQGSSIHVKFSQFVNKMCSQQACSKSDQVVTQLLFHQAATS